VPDQILQVLYSFAPSRLCVRLGVVIGFLTMASLFTVSAHAEDNELTAEEKAAGWILLFNGRDLTGWQNNNGKPLRAKIDDGAVNAHGAGGYLLVYEKPLGDFVFKCDVKMDQPYCNSGIFVRVGDLKNPVQSGMEVQIVTEKDPDMHGFGAIYDLVAPSKNASHGPGKWDTVEIRCKGPEILVTVNSEKVASINCDQWPEPGKRPDGTRHKFRKAIKDFPRQGHLGLQDHGYNAWYKNIKLKKL
jgi:Domain of Unknown Function (DUF1080)